MKKNVWIHIGMVVAMMAVALIYFLPVIQGKGLYQGDTMSFNAMVKETKDFHEKTGEYAHWNSAMFSGMPAYQVGGNPRVKSVFTPIKEAGTLQFLGLHENAGVLFFYLIGFYIALLALGCTPWLALLGALAFGLGSYNIIIIEAGHISKGWAIAMVAPILAGMILCLRKARDGKKKWGDWLWGGLLFVCALSIQLLCNHIQITFYTIIGAVVLGFTYAVYALKDKYLPQFFYGIGILLAGCAIAFACNARNLMVSMEYSSQTMRGGNVISVTPEDLYQDNEANSIAGKHGGLDIDYAFSWSYGVGETYTLLVPGAMGGGSGEPAKSGSKYAQLVDQQPIPSAQKEQYKANAPYYWGDQPFTSGPVYFGAIIIFLFVLGLILVKGPERWWLLFATIIAIIMSWGRNFMPVNEWLFNNLPMYNKFRTPSMSLVLANVTMVLLGILGLKQLLNKEMTQQKANKALYWAGGITGAIILIGLILSGMWDYTAANDAQMDQGMRDILTQDRKSLYVSDSWRSLIFVALAFAILWLTTNKNSNRKYTTWFMIALTLLTAIDLWGVDRRYLNDMSYAEESELTLRPQQYDYTIDEMAAQFGDKDYRVLNLATNTFNDAKPSAFHHQIGGYSAVKMRRYQDIIDFYISRHINMQVLNMLNARYIVVQGGQVQRNPDALGNAWFVESTRMVGDANGEILALNTINPKNQAVINWADEQKLNSIAKTVVIEDDTVFSLAFDSTATIVMEHQNPYNPDYLKYNSHAADDQLAVFSEIYYEPDWRAYIDGKPAEYMRANYILRAMVIPAGDHVIEFRNEAPLFHRMDTVTIIGSIILVLLATGAIILYYRKRKEQE